MHLWRPYAGTGALELFDRRRMELPVCSPHETLGHFAWESNRARFVEVPNASLCCFVLLWSDALSNR